MKYKILLLCIIINLFTFLVLADDSNVKLIGRILGTVSDAYVSGNYAYLCNVDSIIVLDVSNPSNPAEIQRVRIPYKAEMIYVTRDRAYIAGYTKDSDGIHPVLYVMEISDQGMLQEMGVYKNDKVDLDTYFRICGICVTGNFAYLLSNRSYMQNNKSRTDSYLQVIDVSIPTDPHEVGLLIVPGGNDASNMQVSGNYAYIVSDGLHIIDISNPKNMHEIVLYNNMNGIIHVVGNYVYWAFYSFPNTYGLLVLDVSDHKNPLIIGSYNTDYEINGIYVDGNYTYISSFIGNEGGWGSSAIHVIDTSAPKAIYEVGVCDTAGLSSAERIYVINGYAYVINNLKGIHIFDVSNHRNLYEVGMYDQFGISEGIYVTGDYAYVAEANFESGESGESGIRVINISDPKNPRLMNSHELGAHGIDGIISQVYVSGKYAYVAASDSNSNLYIIDISDPRNPHEVFSGMIPTKSDSISYSARGVCVAGNYAYITSYDEFRVIDVSNTKNPIEIGFCSTPYGAGKIYIDGNYAYIAYADRAHDKAGLRIIDISDPKSPYEIGFWDTQGNVNDVYVINKYAYITDSNSNNSGSSLRVIDVSNPKTPREVGLHNIPSSNVNGIDVAGVYAYIASSSGLIVLDISNPQEPYEVEFFDIPDGAQDVQISNGLAYITNTDGLYILQYTGSTTCLKGDVNGDGSIKSNDAILALRISAGLITPTPEQTCSADMNDDGKVGANDAILILRKVAGLGAPLKNIIAKAVNLVTVALGEIHGISGQSITVPVKIDNTDIAAGGDICITYDSSVLRAVSAESEHDVFIASNVSEPGKVKIAFATTDKLNSKTLANIKFDILTDKVSPLILQSVEFYSHDATPINSGKVNGRFSSWAIKPERSALLQNFPNPFNPDTWIPYQIKDGSDVLIRIYSASGMLVRELRLGYKSAGLYVSRDRSAYWDGRNGSGEKIASGVYFYNIHAGNFNETRKMTVMK